MNIIEHIEKKYLRKLTPFNVGDTVGIHVKISEGSKERIQVFSGTVIAKHGRNTSATFTVRRIVSGEGVERVFPLHSPLISKIEVTKRGRIRRAKLYYLRDRSGKRTRLREVQINKNLTKTGKTSGEVLEETVSVS